MKHLNHYLPLFGIFAAGIIGFWIFSYDNLFRFILIITIGVSYIVWGLTHHYVHKDLTPSVILEYIAYTVLGVVIVSSILFRV